MADDADAAYQEVGSQQADLRRRWFGNFVS